MAAPSTAELGAPLSAVAKGLLLCAALLLLLDRDPAGDASGRLRIKVKQRAAEEEKVGGGVRLLHGRSSTAACLQYLKDAEVPACCCWGDGTGPFTFQASGCAAAAEEEAQRLGEGGLYRSGA